MPEYLNKTNGDNIVNNNDNDNNNGNNNADITTEETNSAVIISLYGTSVLALVTIIGFILIKKIIYVKRPKPNYSVGGLHDNLTNSNNDFKRNYQFRFYKIIINLKLVIQFPKVMVHVSTWNKILMFSKPKLILIVVEQQTIRKQRFNCILGRQ
ncbi:hypothetical protein U3516DRAFT_734764 [Neocallimastix sp. 'constans']